jgi:probable DNA repair protein
MMALFIIRSWREWMSLSYLDQLLPEIAKGALVVTANKRLFRFLRNSYDQWMLEKGEQVWRSPEIYSYDAWLDQCATELGERWRLLSSQQLQCLWEQLVEQSSQQLDLELLQVARTAEKALAAWRLLNEYELELPQQGLTGDQQVFEAWACAFETLCRKQEWLDRSDLPALVCRGISCGQLELPGCFYMVGFDQLAPGLEKIVALLEQRGCRCQEHTLEQERQAEVRHYVADDKDAEVLAAARWTRRLLEQGETSIGIVVPDLKDQRSLIERVFQQQIDPLSVAGFSQDDATFGLSLGAPLAEEGIIHAALNLLALKAKLTFEQLSFLLRTPYTGGGSRDADARHQFERRLRSYRQPSFTLRGVLKQLEKRSDLNSLKSIVEKILESQGQTSCSPGRWAQNFADELKRLGWPGDRSLSSREYQALKAYQDKVLAGLTALDRVLSKITRQRALSLLQQIARTVEFQIEAPAGPVQVVGLLESSGLQFDHLWVMGGSEATLPAAPQPNPFIPYLLQSEYAMPHATAERELDFAKQVYARLRCAADDIVFSYPQWIGDSRQRPSPLLPAANVQVAPLFADPQDLTSLASMQPTPLEVIIDRCGLPLEQTEVEGGTDLLKDQAHCPFRAYLHHRLKARRLDSPEPGISPLTRGDLVHLALEKIWQQLGTSVALGALTEVARRELIWVQVDQVLITYYAERVAPSVAMLQLEHERIAGLVDEWLTFELSRDPFGVVESEQRHMERLGPLQIVTKIDRIDSLADGRRIVIDYKTGGQLRATDFLTRPLIEPQLPIYAMTAAQQTDAIAFAQVRKGECSFAGLANDAEGLPGVKQLDKFAVMCAELEIEDWPQLLAYWRGQIEDLAEQFVAGEAVVQPFSLTRSCTYCDLAGICRIQEYVGELEEE